MVCYLLQSCSEVLQSLERGELGACETRAAEYKAACHQLFQYATVFAPPHSLTNGPDKVDPEVTACEAEQ